MTAYTKSSPKGKENSTKCVFILNFPWLVQSFYSCLPPPIGLIVFIFMQISQKFGQIVTRPHPFLLAHLFSFSCSFRKTNCPFVTCTPSFGLGVPLWEILDPPLNGRSTTYITSLDDAQLTGELSQGLAYVIQVLLSKPTNRLWSQM